MNLLVVGVDLKIWTFWGRPWVSEAQEDCRNFVAEGTIYVLGWLEHLKQKAAGCQALDFWEVSGQCYGE